MYRPLTDSEISQLEQQFCSCKNWNDVMVVDDFEPDNIKGVTFSGNVKLGKFEKIYTLKNGLEKISGIYNSHIHNSELGNNSYIKNVNQIVNYKIGDNCFLVNIAIIETQGESTFGNGTAVAVLDETGSRAVKIFDELSASTAYILTMYKHDEKITSQLNKCIDAHITSKKSTIGSIGNNVTIKNSTGIINVHIDPFTDIYSAQVLKNGTIKSSAEAKTFIGHGVIAKDFIISKGARVFENAIIDNCFIGEACLVGKQFSAMHSLFFSNCEMLHGEAVSVFAGPFTVSHHKSTLLIGGMFSFFNAGSGTNMSNHMYKLGPIHYGIMQRGCKMASDSYLMWPGKIGAYSLVIGKIKKHIDTSELPFSYIIESNGEYSIMPAMNITSIGTFRDVKKWSQRDKRQHKNLQDQINFNFLNPYIISKITTAISILTELKEKSKDNKTIAYKGCKIKSIMINKAISLYQMLIDIYLGEWVSKIDNKASNESSKEWVDLSGCIVPKDQLNKMLEKAKKGEVRSIIEIDKEIKLLHKEISTYELSWINNQFEIDKIKIIEQSNKAKEKYMNILLSDAKKDFDDESKICYGNDQEEYKNIEHLNLKGNFDNHPIISEINTLNFTKE